MIPKITATARWRLKTELHGGVGHPVRRTMKNVIILGASGNIAKDVIDILVKKDDIKLD